MTRWDVVVFDLDGTLVDSRAAIVGAAEAALAELALPPPDPRVLVRAIGLPLAEVLAAVAPPDAPLDRLVDGYRRAYVALDASPTAFPGIEALLDGVPAPIAVATGKSVDGAVRVLRALGWLDRFGAVIGHESVPRPKPHPDMVHAVWRTLPAAPDRTLVVGDTTFDLDMGRAAGAVTCAVTWGHHPEERLRASGPDHVVRSVRELAAIVGAPSID